MLVGSALLPLIVAAFLFFGLRWTSHELAFLVLLVAICEVSLMPGFHLMTTQLASTLEQGLLLALRESIVWLPALFFVYVQYATHTSTLVMQFLARLVPSHDLLALLLVLGVGPCLASWGGTDAAIILLLPLLRCLHQDRTHTIALGVLSLLCMRQGTVAQTVLATASGYNEALLILTPVVVGASLAVVRLSHHTGSSGSHWGTALIAACLTTILAGLLRLLLPPAAVSMGTGTAVMALLFLRGRRHAALPRSSGAPLTHRQTMRVLLPYTVLCGSFCVRTLFSSPSPETLPLPFSFPSLLPWGSAGLGLVLATLLVLWFAPLRLMHLRRVASVAGHQTLPIVATLGCFWSTFLLMDRSGMLLALARSLTLMHLDGLWAALLGAGEGWLLHAPQALLTSMGETPSTSWILATQIAVALLTASVAPVTLLLAQAATGATDAEAHLLARVGLLLLLPWFALKDKVRAHSLQGRLLTQTVGAPLPLPTQVRSWLAVGALVLVNVLYASSSLVSLDPLSRLDPTIFLCLQMLLLVPPGLLLLRSAHIPLTRTLLWRGLQLGACLAAGLLCVALSLKETGILETTIFSCLNGVIAMLMARWLFGQRLSRWNWGVGGCLLLGAFLVWLVAPLHWQSNMLAFVAGFLLTCDGFQVEQLLADYGPQQAATIRAIVGVQCLAMAGFTTIVALCFGHWQTLHLLVPSDLPALCYLSYGTILLPCLSMLWAQRTLSAVTVACGSVIEPMVSLGVSMVLAGEPLPLLALVGSSIVLVGMGLQVLASTFNTL